MRKHWMTLSKTERFGFSLIELLVVVVIIALLIAVLIPSLSIAKERARRVVCSNNVNQFIVGLLIYAEGSSGKLPSSHSEAAPGDEHTPVISKKIGDMLIKILGDHRSMECSWLKEPFGGDELWYYDGYGYVLGYNYLGGHTDTPWSIVNPGVQEWKSPQRNTDPSNVELVTELNFWVPGDRTFAPHGLRGPINKYHKPFSGGMTPKQAGAVGGNIGLLDGSVSWKKMEDMKVYRGSRLFRCFTNW